MAGLVGQTGFFPGDRRLRELDLLGDGLSLMIGHHEADFLLDHAHAMRMAEARWN